MSLPTARPEIPRAAMTRRPSIRRVAGLFLGGALMALGGVGATCPEGMAEIPGGGFGSALHGDVELASFCLDRTEVTVAAYADCVAEGGCEPAADTVEVDGMSDEDERVFSLSCNRDRDGADGHPINCLTFAQADAFCRHEGARLPTADEWEWAARGGDEGRLYPWGDLPPGARLANVCGAECFERLQELGRAWRLMHFGDDGFPTTAPVGSLPRGAGRWDVQDLAGNVWEFTADTYGGDPEVRIIRGGGWAQTNRDLLRSAAWNRYPASSRGSAIGFRCAADLPATE